MVRRPQACLFLQEDQVLQMVQEVLLILSCLFDLYVLQAQLAPVDLEVQVGPFLLSFLLLPFGRWFQVRL